MENKVMIKLANKNDLLSENETERVKNLYEYNILDTEKEKEFDELAQLAATITSAPIAIISFLDKKRQWFKSHTGLNIQETSRVHSFCQYTILQDQVLEIQDTFAHPHFKDNPYVTDDPFIRFYAGAPLVTENGFAIGSICVLDKKPGKLTKQQKDSLILLSRQVVSLLELKKEKSDLEKQNRTLLNLKDNDYIDLYTENKILSSILDRLPYPVYVKNKNGEYVYSNQAQAELYNIPAAEICNKTDDELVTAPQTLKFIKESDSKTWIEKRPFHYKEQTFTGPVGYTYTLDTIKSIIDKENNHGPYLLGMSVDRTKEKAVEKALQQAKDEYQKLAENSLDMIARLGKNGQHIYVNKAAEDILGIPAEQLTGKTLRQIGAPDDICHKMEKSTQLVFDSKTGYEEYFPLKTPNGNKFIHLVLKPEFDSNNKVLSVLCTIRDLTALKKTEEKHKEAIDELKHFLYKTSHILKGPVSTIKGLALLGRNEFPDIGFWDQIMLVEQRLSDTLKRLTEVHRLKDGETVQEDINIRNLLLDMVSEIEQVTGQEVKSRLVSEIDPSVSFTSDLFIFEVILKNTIENAVFNSAPSDKINLSIYKRNSFVIIEIEDSGEGMEELILLNAMEMFYKGNSNSQGPGLGLYLVKLAVQKLKGDIYIKSDEGKGTVISIYLPVELQKEHTKTIVL